MTRVPSKRADVYIELNGNMSSSILKNRYDASKNNLEMG